MYSYNGATPQPYYYRRNLQGDVIAIYDANGTRTVEYAYDAFGNCTVKYSTISDLASNNPIRYRGYYYDRETGLYYLNARYYNPQWRRFVSPLTSAIDSTIVNYSSDQQITASLLDVVYYTGKGLFMYGAGQIFGAGLVCMGSALTASIGIAGAVVFTLAFAAGLSILIYKAGESLDEIYEYLKKKHFEQKTILI